MSNETRLEKLERAANQAQDVPGVDGEQVVTLFEVLIDAAFGEETFFKLSEGAPEALDFDALIKRDVARGVLVCVFDAVHCAHSPFCCDDELRITADTVFLLGDFARGDFLKAYIEYHTRGREARAQIVQENESALSKYAGASADEWRAVLSFAAHAAMNRTNRAALHRGDFVSLDSRWLDFVTERVRRAGRIAPLIALEKKSAFTWRGRVLHLLSDTDKAALMSGDYQAVSDAGIAMIAKN